MRCQEVAIHVDVAKLHGFAATVKGRRIQTSLQEKDIRIQHRGADKRGIWVFLQCTRNKLASRQRCQ